MQKDLYDYLNCCILCKAPFIAGLRNCGAWGKHCHMLAICAFTFILPTSSKSDMGICESTQKENIKDRAEFNRSVCLGHCLNSCLNMKDENSEEKCGSNEKNVHQSFIGQKNATLRATQQILWHIFTWWDVNVGFTCAGFKWKQKY